MGTFPYDGWIFGADGEARLLEVPEQLQRGRADEPDDRNSSAKVRRN